MTSAFVFRSTEKLSENTVFLGPAFLTVSFTFASENLLVRETKKTSEPKFPEFLTKWSAPPDFRKSIYAILGLSVILPAKCW